MYLFYDSKQPTWYKRADWFAVVGVSRQYKGKGSKGKDGMRSSYVIWEEEAYDHTEAIDSRKVLTPDLIGFENLSGL